MNAKHSAAAPDVLADIRAWNESAELTKFVPWMDWTWNRWQYIQRGNLTLIRLRRNQKVRRGRWVRFLFRARPGRTPLLLHVVACHSPDTLNERDRKRTGDPFTENHWAKWAHKECEIAGDKESGVWKGEVWDVNESPCLIRDSIEWHLSDLMAAGTMITCRPRLLRTNRHADRMDRQRSLLRLIRRAKQYERDGVPFKAEHVLRSRFKIDAWTVDPTKRTPTLPYGLTWPAC